jgi:hypothetical protein
MSAAALRLGFPVKVMGQTDLKSKTPGGGSKTRI